MPTATYTGLIQAVPEEVFALVADAESLEPPDVGAPAREDERLNPADARCLVHPGRKYS